MSVSFGEFSGLTCPTFLLRIREFCLKLQIESQFESAERQARCFKYSRKGNIVLMVRC